MEITITALDYFRELELMKKQYGQEEDLYPWIYMLLQMAELKKRYTMASLHQVAGAPKADSVKGRELIRGFASFPDIAIVDSNFEAIHEDDLEKKNILYDLETNINRIFGCVEVKTTKNELIHIPEGNSQIKFIKGPRPTLILGDGESYYLTEKSDKATDVGQLFGELLWYGKVIYTNGLVWKYIKIEKCKNKNKSVKNIIDLRKRLYYKCVDEQELWCKKICDENFEIKIICKTLADFTDDYITFCGEENKKQQELMEKLEYDHNLKKTEEPKYKEWENLINNLKEINWKEN